MLVSITNLCYFFQSRPPITIFFISLVIITFTSFAFTTYIKTTERVENNDRKQNLITLREHLNKMALCTADNPRKINTDENEKFTTLITMDLRQFQNETQIEIIYSLESWQPVCQNEFFEKLRYFTLSWKIAQNLNKTQKFEEICVRFSAPKGLLPENNLNACEIKDEINENSTLYLYSDKELCSNSSKLTKLDLNLEPLINFPTFLSEADKILIYVRLMWFSYTLLFIVVMILIAAMFTTPQPKYQKCVGS